MTVLYYDCFSGISGDMNVAAMIDLGIDKNYLLGELQKLPFNGYKIKIEDEVKGGIKGTSFDVILEENSNEHERNLTDIEHIINSSSLNEKVKKISLDIFMKVALAESKVHGKPLNKVHFHEVGAVDSIIDIVAAAICFEKLSVSKIIASTVEIGSGTTNSQHGILPVPAPATAEILKGVPTKSVNVPFEATTPTGAAILASQVTEFTDNKNFITKKIGYGLGKKIGKIPNVLRVFLGETLEEDDNPEFLREEAVIVECNIDDMNPEIYQDIFNKLLDLGAMDVFMNPIIMKKNRPGILLSVLTNAEKVEEVERLLLFETTSFGVRKYNVSKTMLNRIEYKIGTKYGDIGVKAAVFLDKVIKYKVEYEDCKKAAEKYNVSMLDVYNEVKMDIKTCNS
jgi:pyridinium-3,5-bisthiocarboxylic acid mononucleotide nickel chelatase